MVNQIITTKLSIQINSGSFCFMFKDLYGMYRV
ncbi:hypothetical protein F383_15463 [Gossypium arboreum]|uniref:Uncharacterized protein n=1 Tax=Gossypium arboreum TaxID=29729 RepID=A0A0B0PV47_GOSAR|nr:hypothetical protein F383_15463 [Gossypium arboreum]